MGISAYLAFIETITWEPTYWESLDREKAEEFANKNDMPASIIYEDKEELLSDIRNAQGIITVPKNENGEFVAFIEDIIREAL